jgi:hypothetical protein
MKKATLINVGCHNVCDFSDSRSVIFDWKKDILFSFRDTKVQMTIFEKKTWLLSLLFTLNLNFNGSWFKKKVAATYVLLVWKKEEYIKFQ